jgi:hypothetical protein
VRAAQGLKSTKVVVVCVSDEYALSENCRTEIQFAIKSLKKPVIPVIVGSGSTWQQTVVGMLIAGLVSSWRTVARKGRGLSWCAAAVLIRLFPVWQPDSSVIDLQDADQGRLQRALADLIARVRAKAQLAIPADRLTRPVESQLTIHVGDKVISHWSAWHIWAFVSLWYCAGH